MPRIARMPHLRSLVAQDTVAGDERFTALSESSSIEYLWGSLRSSTRDVARLARLPALREVRVSGRGITSEVAAAFPSRVKVFFES
jgi:hypothetical protein